MIARMLALVLALSACGHVESTPEPGDACEPVSECEASTPGLTWIALASSKVGACTFTRYVCAPESALIAEECAQRWETECSIAPAPHEFGEIGE